MLRPIFVAATFVFATAAFAQGPGPIEIADGYVFAAGPTAQSGAAYMRITNMAAGEDRLVGVASDAAAKVELHGQAQADGVMTMRPVRGDVALPPQQTVVLEQGGLHVMLMGLTAPLAAGDEVSLTLTFAQAGEIEITLPVDVSR